MNTKSLVIGGGLILLATSAFAFDKIEGAFGAKLGDVFDPASAVSKSARSDGIPMYQFKPDKPFRSFDKYFVLITPTTHKIYSIRGIGRVADTESGKEEQATIMQALEEKYGPLDREGLMDGLYNLRHITQGSRYVMTMIGNFVDTAIEIHYSDGDLEDAAEQERLGIEGKRSITPGCDVLAAGPRGRCSERVSGNCEEVRAGWDYRQHLVISLL